MYSRLLAEIRAALGLDAKATHAETLARCRDAAWPAAVAPSRTGNEIARSVARRSLLEAEALASAHPSCALEVLNSWLALPPMVRGAE